MTIKKLIEHLKNKWVLAGGVFILLSVLLILITLSSPQSSIPVSVIKETQESQPVTLPQSIPRAKPSVTIGPTQAALLKIAVEEAKQSAQEYDDWQAQLRADYPWLRKLPLATEKYYVYYDLNSSLFIGRLYPNADNDVEKLKAEIKNRLRNVLEIPVENYLFDWRVNPQ